MIKIGQEITKIEVSTKDKLNELYNSSALTFIGISDDEKSLNDMVRWLKRKTEISNPLPIHIIKGKVMNEIYKLTGSNAYRNNLTLIAIKTEDIKNIGVMAIARFEVDGKWFDDIVNNNLEKEKIKVKPKCALIGEDGNIFHLMGIASQTLKRNGMKEEATEMCNRITGEAKSYDEALMILDEYVEITSKEEMEEDIFE